MLVDDRCELRQLEPFGEADDLGEKVSLQSAATARTAIRAMRDDGIRILAHHSAVALVERLRPAGFGLLAPLLAIRRARLRSRT